MSMHLTTAQAAEAAGVSRWTITRAIKSKELTAIRNNKGQFDIRPEDLAAWRAAPRLHPAPVAHPAPVSGPAPEDALSISALQGQLAVSAEKIEALKAALAQEREERSRERETADRERKAAEQERAAMVEREQETADDFYMRLGEERAASERERGTILEAMNDLRMTRDALLRQLDAPAPAVSQEAPTVPPSTPEPVQRAKGFLARLLGR